MIYAVATTTIVPLRAQANDRSEMTSQLLFGEMMVVMETKGSWCFIKNVADSYEGWVDKKQISQIPEVEAEKLMRSEKFFTKELVTNVYDLSTKQEVSLVFGSHLLGYSNGKATIMNRDFVIKESPLSLKINTTREAIALNARKFIGAPYLWGGKTPFGIDCSGFSQTVFAVCGIDIPRDASQQAQHGQLVDFVGDAIEGDLAFFENGEGHVIHVGIVLRNQKIIHASGQVRVDSLDHNGIFNHEIQSYSHNLRFIKRFL
jgi:hypothetical protein